MPMPAYQEYPALWDQARQAAQGPIDPGFAPNTAPPGNLEAPAVDPDAVLEAARAATAHNPGGPVLGCHVFNGAVWVDRDSWPCAWQTATYLAELGYQVSGPSPCPDGSDWSVTVSGWSAQGLSDRAIELERVVRDLELRHRDVASEAVSRYRDSLRQGVGEDAARRQAMADTPLAPQPPTKLGPAVSERDLILSAPEHRGVLVRVAAAQQAWQVLSAADPAGAAVDRYVECRQVHGYPADQAQAAAVAGVSARAQAAYEIAFEAAMDGSAAGHHRPSRPPPDTQPARHPLAASPQSSTGSPRMQPPPTRTTGQPRHRGR